MCYSLIANCLLSAVILRQTGSAMLPAMASPKEVEIKFVLDDLRAIERKLRALGFRRQTPRTHEINTLYDLPGGVLRQRGELLRLRKYGDQWTLTHKAPRARRAPQIARRDGKPRSKTASRWTAILDRARLRAQLSLREIPQRVERRHRTRRAGRNAHRQLRRDRRPAALDRPHRARARDSALAVHHRFLCAAIREVEGAEAECGKGNDFQGHPFQPLTTSHQPPITPLCACGRVRSRQRRNKWRGRRTGRATATVRFHCRAAPRPRQSLRAAETRTGVPC